MANLFKLCSEIVPMELLLFKLLFIELSVKVRLIFW